MSACRWCGRDPELLHELESLFDAACLTSGTTERELGRADVRSLIYDRMAGIAPEKYRPAPTTEQRAPMTAAEALVELRKIDCECADHEAAQEPRCEAIDLAIRTIEKSMRRVR